MLPRMRRIGLLGGMSWESSAEYNRLVDEAGALLAAEAQALMAAGAGLLVEPRDAPVPVFDTTRLHAERAVELALAGEPDRSTSSP